MRIDKLGAILLFGIAAACPAAAFGQQAEKPRAREASPDSAHAAVDSAATRNRAADPHAGHAMPTAPPRTRANETPPDAHAGMDHGAGGEMEHGGMLAVPLAGGWRLLGMAQVYPIVTGTFPGDGDHPLHDTEAYLTQPAAMLNLESPGARVVLRGTLNFEALTQEDGELTFGGWGEGFIDRRHPHTLVHELMLSANLWKVAGGAVSVSAGKGFAPYGTDDPMSRPAAKYPTNHHLSQILERWTVNGAWLAGGWSVEAGIFGGAEPSGPYDFSNLESFGDSWSARLAKRFGGRGTGAPWELSASYGSVAETHHGEKERTALYNAAARHAGRYAFGGLYALAEASLADGRGGDDFWSLLAETELALGRHRPYYRVELAARPEYAREGLPGEPGFFRYHHDDDPVGASRWTIHTLGYGFDLPGREVTTRPFVEAQLNNVRRERGVFDLESVYGRGAFWSLTAGFRMYFGGGPMRMGSYGVLDDMTTRHRPPGGS
ncbi:MAG TPA: hypothetical protein VFQ39_03800 [Longimicrobium sp.]|nr:hypothetical protein [Longimicrobium sp.]